MDQLERDDPNNGSIHQSSSHQHSQDQLHPHRALRRDPIPTIQLPKISIYHPPRPETSDGSISTPVSYTSTNPFLVNDDLLSRNTSVRTMESRIPPPSYSYGQTQSMTPLSPEMTNRIDKPSAIVTSSFLQPSRSNQFPSLSDHKQSQLPTPHYSSGLHQHHDKWMYQYPTHNASMEPPKSLESSAELHDRPKRFPRRSSRDDSECQDQYISHFHKAQENLHPTSPEGVLSDSLQQLLSGVHAPYPTAQPQTKHTRHDMSTIAEEPSFRLPPVPEDRLPQDASFLHQPSINTAHLTPAYHALGSPKPLSYSGDQLTSPVPPSIDLEQHSHRTPSPSTGSSPHQHSSYTMSIGGHTNHNTDETLHLDEPLLKPVSRSSSFRSGKSNSPLSHTSSRSSSFLPSIVPVADLDNDSSSSLLSLIWPNPSHLSPSTLFVVGITLLCILFIIFYGFNLHVPYSWTEIPSHTSNTPSQPENIFPEKQPHTGNEDYTTHPTPPIDPHQMITLPSKLTLPAPKAVEERANRNFRTFSTLYPDVPSADKVDFKRLKAFVSHSDFPPDLHLMDVDGFEGNVSAIPDVCINAAFSVYASHPLLTHISPQSSPLMVALDSMLHLCDVTDLQQNGCCSMDEAPQDTLPRRQSSPDLHTLHAQSTINHTLPLLSSCDNTGCCIDRLSCMYSCISTTMYDISSSPGSNTNECVPTSTFQVNGTIYKVDMLSGKVSIPDRNMVATHAHSHRNPTQREHDLPLVWRDGDEDLSKIPSIFINDASSNADLTSLQRFRLCQIVCLPKSSQLRNGNSFIRSSIQSGSISSFTSQGQSYQYCHVPDPQLLVNAKQYAIETTDSSNDVSSHDLPARHAQPSDSIQHPTRKPQLPRDVLRFSHASDTSTSLSPILVKGAYGDSCQQACHSYSLLRILDQLGFGANYTNPFVEISDEYSNWLAELKHLTHHHQALLTSTLSLRDAVPDDGVVQSIQYHGTWFDILQSILDAVKSPTSDPLPDNGSGTNAQPSDDVDRISESDTTTLPPLSLVYSHLQKYLQQFDDINHDDHNDHAAHPSTIQLHGCNEQYFPMLNSCPLLKQFYPCTACTEHSRTTWQPYYLNYHAKTSHFGLFHHPFHYGDTLPSRSDNSLEDIIRSYDHMCFYLPQHMATISDCRTSAPFASRLCPCDAT